MEENRFAIFYAYLGNPTNKPRVRKGKKVRSKSKSKAKSMTKAKSMARLRLRLRLKANIDSHASPHLSG